MDFYGARLSLMVNVDGREVDVTSLLLPPEPRVPYFAVHELALYQAIEYWREKREDPS